MVMTQMFQMLDMDLLSQKIIFWQNIIQIGFNRNQGIEKFRR